jgi:competence protein ComEA
MRIKGVGEKTAAAILAYRRAHGPFRDVRELLQIKGIGEKKLEKLRPHIIL